MSGKYSHRAGVWHTIAGGNHSLGARHPLDGIPAPLERGLELTEAWFCEHVGRDAACS